MLNFDEFMERIKKEILLCLPEDKKTNEQNILIKPIHKNNRTLHGIIINSEDNIRDFNGLTVTGILYAEDLFRQYQASEDIETIAKNAVEVLVNRVKEFPMELYTEETYDDKSKIYAVLINTERNKELLSTMPHIACNDLSIIFTYLLGMREDGIMTTKINNNFAEIKLKMNADELYEAALKNSRELFPALVYNLIDVISGNYETSHEENFMLVLKNHAGLQEYDGGSGCGAGYVIYGDILQNISERIDDDLYILPSSVNELIMVPAHSIDDKEYKRHYLLDMVHSINSTLVSTEEYLSDSIYYYNRAENRIYLVDQSGNIDPSSYFEPYCKDAQESNAYNIQYKQDIVERVVTVIAADEEEALKTFEKVSPKASVVGISKAEDCKSWNMVIYS